MSIEEKNELMEALLWMAPDAEVRHLDTLIKAAERNPQGLHTREIIALTKSGVIKIKP